MEDGLKLLVPERETENQKKYFLDKDTFLLVLEIKIQHLEQP